MFIRRIALLVLVLATALPMLAQGRGCCPNYDPKTETTLKGTVTDVAQQAGKRGWNGTHLTLKTETGSYDVHLGPTQFLAQQGFAFAKGDTLAIVASKVSYQGGDAYVARQVTKGDKVLTLRDAQGIPAWSGGRWR